MGSRIETRVSKLESADGSNGDPIPVICFEREDEGPIEVTVAGRKMDCRNLPEGYRAYWIGFYRDGGPQ